MKEFTKTKIAQEMSKLVNWCNRVEDAAKELENMPGVSGLIKGLFAGLGAVAAFVLPASVFAKFLALAAAEETGAAVVTHALKEIAIYFGVFAESMVGGILTLLGLAALGVLVTGLLYLFVDEAVKFYQKYKANFAIEMLKGNVKEAKDAASKFSASPELVTKHEITLLVQDLKSVLNAFGIKANDETGFEFSYVFEQSHEKFKDEHKLGHELAYGILPNISKLRNITDIPAVKAGEFETYTNGEFKFELRNAGVTNYEELYYCTVAERETVYTKEVQRLCKE